MVTNKHISIFTPKQEQKSKNEKRNNNTDLMALVKERGTYSIDLMALVKERGTCSIDLIALVKERETYNTD